MAIGSHLTGLVCGSWEGVGRAVALRLAKEKVNLILPAPSTAIVSNVAKEARSLGASVCAVSVDSSSSSSIAESIASAVSEVGALNFLILSPQLINSHSPLNAAYVLSLARENYLYTTESLSHLKVTSNPHIITLSPHPSLYGEFFHQYGFGRKLLRGVSVESLPSQCRWFDSYFSGQMALLGVTDPIRFRSIQMNKEGVAMNGLWPKHRIWTGGGSDVWESESTWYSASSLAESCVHLLEQPKSQCWGNLLHDETLLHNYTQHQMHTVPEEVVCTDDDDDVDDHERLYSVHTPADISAPVNEEVMFLSPDVTNSNVLVAFYGLFHHSFESRHVCQQLIKTMKPDNLLLELSNTKRMHLAVSIRKEESLSEFQQAFRMAKTQVGKNCPVILGDFVSFTLTPRPTIRMTYLAVKSLMEIIKHFIKYLRRRESSAWPWRSRHDFEEFLHTEFLYLYMVKTPTLCKEREMHIAYKLQEICDSHRDAESIRHVICLVGKAHVPGIMQYYGNVSQQQFNRIRFLPGVLRLIRDIVYLVTPLKRSQFNYIQQKPEKS